MNGAGRLVEPSVLHGMSGRIGGVGRPRILCSTDGSTSTVNTAAIAWTGSAGTMK